jgi:hypothetical protein
MGNICVSKSNYSLKNIEADEESISGWRVMGARQHGGPEGPFGALEDPFHLQLYDLMHEPLAQTLLGKHAETIGKVGLLMCWVEIEEFKSEKNYKSCLIRAVDIFEHFIAPESELCLKTIPREEVEHYDTLITTHTVAGSSIPKDCFAEVILYTYTDIYRDNIFIY